MTQKIVWCGIASFLVILALSILPAVSADTPTQSKFGDRNEPSSAQPLDQQAVAGTLEKVTEGTISLKTSDGDVKIFDISEEKKNQIKNMGLKKGDTAVITLDQKKQIVAVTKLGGG
jgi:hypothetical protein